MRRSQLTDPAARALAQELVELRREVERLKSSNRAAQLANSSVENGTITIYDGAGQPRSMIGKQPDGTFGLGAANGEAPPRPNTPTVIPTMKGLAIEWNGTFVSAAPGDFSHVAIHVSAVFDFIVGPSNQVGTFIRPQPSIFIDSPLDTATDYYVKLVAYNTSGRASQETLQVGPVKPSQVVAQAVLDGIVGELALANDAVSAAKIQVAAITETKIAPDSISTPKIKARAIEAAQIAVAAILAEHITAGSITTEKIAALAITAGEIAANAINAGHIQAGVITAEKLAAQIVLASRIILGDPVGARLEIDEFGISQYSALGDPTLKLGQDPSGGNYFTVVDSLDPQKALASISDTGIMTASGFAVTGDLNYNGDELSALLSIYPKGLKGWGFATGNSPTTTNGVGWFEFEFLADPGRMYKIHTSPMVMKGTGGVVFMRYTLDGTAPTTSSPYLTYAACNNDDTFTMAVLARNDTVNSARFRVLLHVGSFSGNSIFIQDTNGAGHHQIWAEDIGPNRDPHSVTSGGGGGTAPAPRQQVVQWDATWHGTWNPSLRSGLADMVQGPYDGKVNFCAFGFDVTNIRSTISGSTIDKTELYMYINHTYYSSGGFARIRTHAGSPNGIYPGVSGVRWVEKFGKPEGRWLNVGTAVGAEFRDSLTNGFACDARDVAASLNDYIRINGSGQSLRPKVKITFTK